ncbi:MAG TPA: hypothetical protein PKL41_11355, partial [Flavobacteriales bacterium]|nr:hypothetical protein [Flavobacteriales bacterium]
MQASHQPKGPARLRRCARAAHRSRPALLLCVLLLHALPSTAQLTLAHCQERARANQPMIAQYDLIAKTADYTIANANKAYLPQVSL